MLTSYDTRHSVERTLLCLCLHWGGVYTCVGVCRWGWVYWVLLGLQSGGELHAASRGHCPALPGGLVGLQQAVELLEVRHDVVLDVGDGYLQAHAATVKGASAVPREHLADHARHHWNNLSTEERGRVT